VVTGVFAHFRNLLVEVLADPVEGVASTTAGARRPSSSSALMSNSIDCRGSLDQDDADPDEEVGASAIKSGLSPMIVTLICLT